MENVKKKRGRKPKNFEQTDIEPVVEKKKRGRKKKYEIENFDKILNRNEENNFNHSIVYSDDEQQESETNCVKSVSFGNLNITVSKKVSAPIESYKNTINNVKESNINETEWESDEEKEIPIENIIDNKVYNENKKYIPGNASETAIKKNEESVKKIRVVTCLKNNFIVDNQWPETTDVCCWWCCHTFTNCPCTLPVKYDPLRKRFNFIGVFCSWNCTKAYNLEKNDHIKYQRTEWITLLIQQMYGIKEAINVKCAPPRQTLKMFGGYLTINEFRNNNKLVDSYHLNELRFNFIFPEITEMSNIKIKTTPKNLRLSRNG